MLKLMNSAKYLPPPLKDYLIGSTINLVYCLTYGNESVIFPPDLVYHKLKLIMEIRKKFLASQLLGADNSYKQTMNALKAIENYQIQKQIKIRRIISVYIIIMKSIMMIYK